jgi:GH15 family glucan-1,4-alpha-glucosidase
MRYRYLMIGIFFLGLRLLPAGDQDLGSSKKYKGYAVIGNGKVCAVYSDDARIAESKKARGIQHFYFLDYTMDYISSTRVELTQSGKILSGRDSLINSDCFSTGTQTHYSEEVRSELRCFSLASDAIVLQCRGFELAAETQLKYIINLRQKFISDRTTLLASLSYIRNTVAVEWSNGVTILVAPAFEDGIIQMDDSLITISRELPAEKWSSLVLVAGKSRQEVLGKWSSISSHPNFYNDARKYWDSWFKRGKLPRFKKNVTQASHYLEMYRRALYAVKAANLNGQVPADITGQFLTNNMPQLYPRDALMCARVFMLTGHLEEARQIISYWSNPQLPMKHRNEFYARYDAYGQAVDAGSGARFDEPEWDSNGYFIQLVYDYFQKTGKWLADKNALYEFANYLVFRIDEHGLLYEGGIVEWTGYLPATNMICAAALQTASKIADVFNDPAKSVKYFKASQTISDSLDQLFDLKRQTYTALRYHAIKSDDNRSRSEKTSQPIYLWDTSTYYGLLWGYPDHEKFELTNQFILNNTTRLGGGLQYFEAQDNSWLTDYGDDVFFFPTAASAQYNAITGNLEIAQKQIEWLITNSNVYGLMPERLSTDGSDCSEASPLSWCNAEFAAAVLVFSQKIAEKK